VEQGRDEYSQGLRINFVQEAIVTDTKTKHHASFGRQSLDVQAGSLAERIFFEKPERAHDPTDDIPAAGALQRLQLLR
jgi:hypothetical protein